jgi:hypothetical protein
VADIEGYTAFHSYRDGRRGGGVSIYVLNTFDSHGIAELTINTDLIETCSVNVTLSRSSKVKIVGVYRPPNGPCDDRFNDFFYDLIHTHCRPSDKVYCAGDFNVDLLRSTVIQDNFRNMFGSLDFVPLITVPTRVRGNSASLIDHIWTNQLHDISSGVFDVNISDHFPVFIVTRMPCEHETVRKKFRDHSDRYLDALRDRVSSSLIVPNGSADDFDVQFKLVFDKLFYLYDLCCPLREKILSMKTFLKPWITRGIMFSINRKHQMYRDYKRGNLTLDEYNSYKNVTTRLLRESKKMYFMNKFNSAQGNIRKTWSTINYVLNRKNKLSPDISLKSNDTVVRDRGEVARLMNEYFNTVAETLDSSIPTSDVDPVSFIRHNILQSMYLAPSSPAEVGAIISSLPNKSCDSMSVPTYIYKQLKNELSPIISHLFNISIEKGIFPQCLKIVRVIPIFKSGDKHLPKNCQPISTLSVMSKIFEKLMFARLNKFLSKNKILVPNQFGFRPEHSTVDAILEFIDNIYHAHNNNEFVLSVFLDFSKAFDTVNHSILLNKMCKLGIRGLAQDWFHSYLTDRSHYVSIGGEDSVCLTANIGVPQGSVLGPILFLLYINDMCASSDLLNFVHFADDTTVFIAGSDPDILVDTVNAELAKVDIWLQANRLSLNVNKTSFMLFLGPKTDLKDNVCIRNTPLDRVRASKFLGITIDDKLDFATHIKGTLSKLAGGIGMLYKLSNFVTNELLKNIYYSIFYPHLIYGVTVWGYTFEKYLGRVRSCQNRAVSAISGDINLLDRYSSGKLLKFDSILKYFSSVKVYKILTNECQSYFVERIRNEQIPHDYSTRFKVNESFVTPLYKKSMCQRSLMFRGIHFWNELPLRIRKEPSIHVFKKLLKSYLLDIQ